MLLTGHKTYSISIYIYLYIFHSISFYFCPFLPHSQAVRWTMTMWKKLCRQIFQVESLFGWSTRKAVECEYVMLYREHKLLKWTDKWQVICLFKLQKFLFPVCLSESRLEICWTARPHFVHLRLRSFCEKIAEVFLFLCPLHFRHTVWFFRCCFCRRVIVFASCVCQRYWMLLGLVLLCTCWLWLSLLHSFLGCVVCRVCRWDRGVLSGDNFTSAWQRLRWLAKNIQLSW